MKKFIECLAMIAIAISAVSCGSSKSTSKEYVISTDILAPGENGLNFYRLTDDKDLVYPSFDGMDVNPFTNEFAFISKRDGVENVFIKDINNPLTSKQRTFRKYLIGVRYSNNGKQILFSEWNENIKTSMLFTTNAHTGSICNQLTDGYDGRYSVNDSTIFFEKSELSGYKTEYETVYTSGSCLEGSSSYRREKEVAQYERTIWGYNIYNSQLFTICKGENITVIPSEPSSLYCVRNEKEIWKINMTTGAESIIYTYSEPIYSLDLSPDENWIAFVSISTVNERKNDDIFFIKTDGTNFVQITFHEADDFAPRWINGGKELLLISDRGSTDKKYNVWKIANPVYNK